MVKKLARRWADHVSSDTRNATFCVVTAITGLVWVFIYIFLYVLDIMRNDILLLMGLYIVFVGFHLFERLGLLMLMDEIKGKHAGPGME